MTIDTKSASDSEPLESDESEWRRRNPWVVAAVVALLGLAATALVAHASWSQIRSAQHKLLVAETRQAGNVIAAAIPSTQSSLDTAAQLAAASGPQAFRAYMAPKVGGPQGFVSSALWRVQGNDVIVLSGIGSSRHFLPMTSSLVVARAALHTTSYVVLGEPANRPVRLGYAHAIRTRHGDYVVFAERGLPRNRRASVARNSAFSDLYYAIYLGTKPNPSKLLSIDFPLLDQTRDTTLVRVPFGNTHLTMLTAARRPLDGRPAVPPWTIVLVGVLVSIGAALLIERLVLQRRTAENSTHRVELLSAQSNLLHVKLQRSLLPARLPDIPGIEAEVRYLPGGQGAQIGGDWYSLLSLGEGRYGFVIGDVSGKGLPAAGTMAAMRYTARTLLLEGNSPAQVMARTAEMTHDIVSGGLVTVIVGVGDVNRGRVSLAIAGHPLPLLVQDGTAAYLKARVGPPIGVINATYVTNDFDLPVGATLFAFTDGLVERPGLSLRDGLDRLAAVGASKATGLHEFVTHVCEAMTLDSVDDDVAVLAIRPTF